MWKRLFRISAGSAKPEQTHRYHCGGEVKSPERGVYEGLGAICTHRKFNYFQAVNVNSACFCAVTVTEPSMFWLIVNGVEYLKSVFRNCICVGGRAYLSERHACICIPKQRTSPDTACMRACGGQVHVRKVSEACMRTHANQMPPRSNAWLSRHIINL